MLKLYYDLMSQPSRALYIFLNKTKIPYEKCKVDIAKGGTLAEDYEKVHPFRQVPAIADGDFKLIESVAIFRYLCRTRPVADHWYPADPAAAARVDAYAEWQHANTRFHCALYFRHKVLNPVMFGTPVKESSVQHYTEGMEQVMDRLDKHWLAKSPYIAGDKISVADILAITEMYQPSISGFDCFRKHASVSDWHDRVKDELNPDFDDAHAILYRMKAKYDNMLAQQK